MAAPVYTPADVDRIADWRGRGLSCAVIARLLGKGSRDGVRYVCMREGIASPLAARHYRPSTRMAFRRGATVVRRFSPAEDAELLRLEAAGQSYAAIGRALNRKPHTIIQRLRSLAMAEARREAEDETSEVDHG